MTYAEIVKCIGGCGAEIFTIESRVPICNKCFSKELNINECTRS